MQLPDWLLTRTFRIEYNPNCPSPFLVRLVGRGSVYIRGNTDDAIGFGQTITEAAERARVEAERGQRFLNLERKAG